MQFSRNFGKPVAILAGLKESSGDLVINLDADGQHPPALIPELISFMIGLFVIILGLIYAIYSFFRTDAKT